MCNSEIIHFSCLIIFLKISVREEYEGISDTSTLLLLWVLTWLKLFIQGNETIWSILFKMHLSRSKVRVTHFL